MTGAVETVTISAVNYSVFGLGNADPVADADEYFAASLTATGWTGATSTQKAQALVTAARMLGRAVIWSGTPTVATQALAWPRDNATNCGEAVTDGTIPDAIVYGEFELALALLNDAAVETTPGTGSNVRRAKAGSAEVEFFAPTLGTDIDNRLPLVAHELLHCYYAGTGASSGMFIDGTDATCVDERSAFDSGTDYYGLSGPY